MKPLAPDISLDQEVDAIVSFVAQTWSPIPNLKEIVTTIKDAATHDLRAYFDWYIINTHARKLETERRATIASMFPGGIDTVGAYLYDNVCHMLGSLTYHTDSVRKEALAIDGPWDFETRTKPITSKLKKLYPQLKSARPLGWKELAQNYSDFDGQEEYDPTDDDNLFEGSDTVSAGAAALPGRLALPYAMYSDKCQGRSPSYTLVSSIYAHFMRIMEYMNSLNACNALDSLGLPNSKELVFNLMIQTDNPLLKVLIAMAEKPYTEEDYLKAVAYQKAFVHLPDSEKQILMAKHKAEQDELSSQIISEILKERDSGVAELEDRAKSTKIRNLLLNEFGM